MRAPWSIALLLLAVLSVSVAFVRLTPNASAAWPTPFCQTRGIEASVPTCDEALKGRFPDLTAAKEVVFAVIGDMGTGTDDQKTVGKALVATCKARGCRFAISVGDNLYDGPEVAGDSRFEEWFRGPYAGLDIPVWLSLGNHDWYGNPQAEVDRTGYSAKEETGPYWFMPGPMFTVPGLPNWLDLVAIDTMSVTKEDAAAIADQKRFLGAVLPGTPILARRQWTFLFGHHPYRSSGAHGDTKPIQTFLKSWLDGITIDGAFFGHDHHQEHFDAGSCQLFIQGATAQVRSVGFDAKTRHCPSDATSSCSRWAALDLGFAIVKVTEHAFTVDFHRVEGDRTDVVYSWSTARQALGIKQSPRP